MAQRIFKFLGFYKVQNEMSAALEECEKLNIPVVYGDRDQGETVKRVWSKLSTVGVAKMLMGVPSAVKDSGLDLSSLTGRSDEEFAEMLKTREKTRSVVELLRRLSPEAARVLIDERDDILCDAIKNAPVCRLLLAKTGVLPQLQLLFGRVSELSLLWAWLVVVSSSHS
jgi:pheromone shutdown protein TraB